jgi:hypothetical protein
MINPRPIEDRLSCRFDHCPVFQQKREIKLKLNGTCLKGIPKRTDEWMTKALEQIQFTEQQHFKVEFYME